MCFRGAQAAATAQNHRGKEAFEVILSGGAPSAVTCPWLGNGRALCPCSLPVEDNYFYGNDGSIAFIPLNNSEMITVNCRVLQVPLRVHMCTREVTGYCRVLQVPPCIHMCTREVITVYCRVLQIPLRVHMCTREAITVYCRVLQVPPRVHMCTREMITVYCRVLQVPLHVCILGC